MGRDLMICKSEMKKMGRGNALTATSPFSCKYATTDKEHQQSGFVIQILAGDFYGSIGVNNNMTIKVGAAWMTN